ncbi:hypothetical protein ETS23_06320 [Vibrio parahaemolyticus]|nr:hypothetical protein [Vibrio parahaemolyticus]
MYTNKNRPLRSGHNNPVPSLDHLERQHTLADAISLGERPAPFVLAKNIVSSKSIARLFAVATIHTSVKAIMRINLRPHLLMGSLDYPKINKNTSFGTQALCNWEGK